MGQNRKKVLVVGAGISGLSISNMLKNRCDVVVLEKSKKPGGLIKCKNVDGYLYHIVGGHVFNSKNRDVLSWFWSFFNQNRDFVKTTRNAVISLDNKRLVKYPIENNVYELEKNKVGCVIEDLLKIYNQDKKHFDNFEDFLVNKFGETLYNLYFRPYNEKIWKCDLSKIPLDWLEGKLPMPSIKEIFYNNFCGVQETSMVHSSFFYPKVNGSQFLADTLAENLDVKYGIEVNKIERVYDKWIVNGEYACDVLIYTGNIKMLMAVLPSSYIKKYSAKIEELEFHGTTSVLSLIDNNPFSWIYLPSELYKSHRIICTGNFSESNNVNDKLSATIEFTDYVDKNEILESLSQMPFAPKYLDHTYTKYTYPIQNVNTKSLISSIKSSLEGDNLFLLGRFAEWEYYNMDAAMEAALDLAKKI